MPTDTTRLRCDEQSDTRAGTLVDKQVLALDALSKLTRQFCDKPDFERFIDVLMMTLCGQFSVADVFALLKKPSSHSLNQSFFATGRFKKDVMLASLQVAVADLQNTLRIRHVRKVSEIEPSSEWTHLLPVLVNRGVNLVCPLIHNDKFFGIIGLGKRVTGKAYAEEDMELLNTIINTVTPLVANSYLFWDIASLNAWYLDILDNVKQGVFVFDDDCRLKKINSAGLDILRTFRSDDVSLASLENAPMEQVFPESVFNEWARQFSRAKANTRKASIRSIVARSGGNERIYNVSITGSVENTEMGTALIITLDDVTVQKESEQRLFDLQKFADKGLMASSIAHELNNFLGLILGGVEVIEIALESQERGKAGDTINKLKNNIGNMERFTRGLTDLASLDSSRELLNLNTVIGDVLSFLSVQKRFKWIEITPALDPELPDLDIDKDQIAQLLLNLLNNAADAIGESPRKQGVIIIRTEDDDRDALLIVSDNGTGMNAEVKKKLFRYSFTTKQGGHGYGLVTCARIVENHGGTINVDSKPGKGTTFTIRLPKHPSPVRASLRPLL